MACLRLDDWRRLLRSVLRLYRSRLQRLRVDSLSVYPVRFFPVNFHGVLLNPQLVQEFFHQQNSMVDFLHECEQRTLKMGIISYPHDLTNILGAQVHHFLYFIKISRFAPCCPKRPGLLLLGAWHRQRPNDRHHDVHLRWRRGFGDPSYAQHPKNMATNRTPTAMQLLKIVVWVSKSSVFLEVFHLNFLRSLHDYLQNNRIPPFKCCCLEAPWLNSGRLARPPVQLGDQLPSASSCSAILEAFLEVDLEKKWIKKW